MVQRKRRSRSRQKKRRRLRERALQALVDRAEDLMGGRWVSVRDPMSVIGDLTSAQPMMNGDTASFTVDVQFQEV
jgi:hypothetical protein